MSTINIEVTKNVYDVDLQQNVTSYDVTLEKGYYPLPGGGGGDTSNLVPYTGANKDVNIASNYFKTSKGFDFTFDEDNYFRTYNSGKSCILDFLSKDDGLFSTTNFLVNSEDFNIIKKNNVGLILNNFTVTNEETFSLKPFVSDSGFKTTTGTANQALTANGGVYDLTTKADLVSGKIPSSQLPSYVDDVLEFANLASFPAIGEIGKIYIAIDNNLTYRWGGSSYVVMSSSLALGETESTAYRGDRGKIAYDHSQATGNPHNTKVEELTDVGSETPSIVDTDIILKKETGGLWQKINWANIKANLKTYFDNLYAPKSFNVKITTPSSWVTGATAETEVLRIEIPANSISDNSFLNMPILYLSKIGTNGNMSIKGKLSTSPIMPSGTTDVIFGYTNIGATLISFGMDRMYIVSDGLIKGYPFGISSYSSSNANTNSFSSKPFDRTVTNYLYISITLGNSADKARLEGIQLTNS